MPFRLQGYRWKIMQQHLEQVRGDQLPIVYALVFYNGKTSYTYSTDILDLFADKDLAEATLYKPFQLVNLHDISDEEIRQHQWSGLMEFIAKHIYDKDMLTVLHEIGKLVHNLSNETFGVVDYTVLAFEYIISAGNIDDKQAFVNTVKKILPAKIGAEIMTIAELYKQEGRQEGRQVGIQEGRQEGKQEGLAVGRFEGKLAVAKKMLAEGFNRDVVAKVTDLSAEQVQKLKETAPAD
jgi:predicted transposase/invertase (TIGR01784 family)